jgi:hypothetical protein
MSTPHEPPPETDPFDLLAAMSDRDERALRPGEDPVADSMFARIVAAPPVVSITRRRRRGLVTAAAVVAVAVAGSAVAAVWSREPADAVSLRCYSDASATPAVEVGLVTDPAVGPADQCAAAWSDGRISRDGPPELIACVDALDSTVVVPGGPETCGELGWVPVAEPTAGARVDAQVVRQVADVLNRCEPNPSAATLAVQAVFDELGAEAWTVSAPPSSTGGGCIVPVADAINRTVALVELPMKDR